MPIDPREAAKKKFEKILEEKKSTDETANKIVWAATAMNVGLGALPMGLNFWTFIGVSTVMVIWLGRVYGQTLTNESAGQLIKQIFYSVGAMFFMTTLGIKFGAEVLKVSGLVSMGGTTVAGMALDAVLMGAITYAIGFTSKEMFKRKEKLSKSEIKDIFKQRFKEGKEQVKTHKDAQQ